MKGRNHLRMGACTVGCVSAVGLVPYAEAPAAVAAGIGLFLFGKVAPDLDHRSSSVTRSWWLLSKAYSAIVRGVARFAYETSRGPGDPQGAAVHRGFTHTLPGALLGGALLVVVILAGPIPTSVGCGLAIGSAGYVYDRGWRIWAALTGAGIGYFAWVDLLAAVPWVWFVFTVGCFAHAVDDCVTTAGAPLRFPFKDEKGRRWRKVGTPEWMRFDTGSRVETAVVWGALIATSGLLYLFLLQPLVGPWLIDTFGGIGYEG